MGVCVDALEKVPQMAPRCRLNIVSAGSLKTVSRGDSLTHRLMVLNC